MITHLFRSYSKTSLYTMKKYDLVIYGATGFTGQYVVEEVARVAAKEKSSNKEAIKWAIAGRNTQKLQTSLTEARNQTGLSLDDVDIVIADNKDESTLKSMASQAKCIINCVGPYQHFGEPVVKACIENGANHVDISGEPQFLESMQLKYDADAEKAGVHVVGACGFDSVPVDVGIGYMEKQFKGPLNSVETFLKFKSAPGGSIHTGTMESFCLVLSHEREIHQIRRKLFPEKLPKPKFRKEKRGFIHKNDDVNLWAMSFPSDEPVVYRTQRYFHENDGKVPVQFQNFIGLRSLSKTIGMALGLGYFWLMSFFSWTRALLLKYPEVMTAGVFTRKGADRETLKKMGFTHIMVGKGWSEKLQNKNDQYDSPPDCKMVLKVSGPDPAYSATSLMMVASAMTIIREKESCLRPGGVMTPGIAFYNTNIIDRMVEQGMKFDLENK